MDLHHFQPKDVKSVVEEYLIEARRAGFREVRLIHGKGIGVQRDIVRQVLASTAFVLRFYEAPSYNGGRGATMAELQG